MFSSAKQSGSVTIYGDDKLVLTKFIPNARGGSDFARWWAFIFFLLIQNNTSTHAWSCWLGTLASGLGCYTAWHL